MDSAAQSDVEDAMSSSAEVFRLSRLNRLGAIYDNSYYGGRRSIVVDWVSYNWGKMRRLQREIEQKIKVVRSESKVK
jgi:hypothetical protein